MTDELDQGAVVVGVDGSPGSLAAIQLAAREAKYRGAELVAVMAYSGERALSAPAAQPVASLPADDDERLGAESALRDAVHAALGDKASTVQRRAMLGLAGRQLIETAAQTKAQLIVLATRGSMSLLIGTVSQYVLRNAPCPVLLVPGAKQAA